MADTNDLESRAATLKRESYYKLLSTLIECSDILKSLAPTRRRPWLTTVIEELYRSQQGRCALCLNPISFDDFDIDHKVPFCYGGGNERNNIQLAHFSCNRSKKSEVDPLDLLRYLEDRYMNL